MKKLSWIVALFLLVAAGWGCAGGSPTDQEVVKKYTVPAERRQEVAQFNRQLMASADMNVDRGDYLLGPGDLLEIKVFESEELGATVRVSSRGFITLPLLGQVKVKDLTARKAELKIEEKYSKKYIKNPHVSIFIKEHFSQRITVVGEVENPGTYDYPSRLRLLDALALAGGLTEKAGRSVQIRRMGNSPRDRGSFIVDLDRLVNEGETEQNIRINGGDVIFVPEAGVFFVDGAVCKPGAYTIQRDTTVQEALLTAGGFKPYADEEEIILVRYSKDGDREVKKLDLEEPACKRMRVQDRDVIIAKKSAWGVFVHGISIRAGVPGAGIGYSVPE